MNMTLYRLTFVLEIGSKSHSVRVSGDAAVDDGAAGVGAGGLEVEGGFADLVAVEGEDREGGELGADSGGGGFGEYRGAKLLITEQFPETAGSITSFHVESDVVSLNGREPLQTDAEIGDDGKLHVVVRRSSTASSRSVISSYNKSHNITGMTPRASNLTGVEIYSVQSSRGPTPRASSFNQSDFYAMFSKAGSKAESPKHGYTSSFGGGDVFSMQSSKGLTPRTSNFEEEMLRIGKNRTGGRSMSGELFNNNNNNSNNSLACSYPPPIPNPTFSLGSTSAAASSSLKKKETGNNKELHMFVWSSTASPVSEGNMKHAINKAAAEFGAIDPSKAVHTPGLFMALQPKIIACGQRVATFSMAVRFLTGPAVMAATSIAIGLRGVLLHVAIVQAALPQGIVPFVFAKEYNVHADILSTAVIFGMLIALPITILYYVLLGV
ncbi:hypothetical protein L1987_29715 [Smallanthus sonchifolius]|uniref:Uncharacterized protein n=1 Tax=Smallanthus sonchifolius TaxID=185202 RepID=A0ACB9I1H8_9ASTR|nr:hypothetical protein L1987_29715 [Smallanthus sonchifolius]